MFSMQSHSLLQQENLLLWCTVLALELGKDRFHSPRYKVQSETRRTHLHTVYISMCVPGIQHYQQLYRYVSYAFILGYLKLSKKLNGQSLLFSKSLYEIFHHGFITVNSRFCLYGQFAHHLCQGFSYTKKIYSWVNEVQQVKDTLRVG